MALIVAFMAVEVVIGIVSGSLPLISYAGHMLTDTAAIALALVAARLAARPSQGPDLRLRRVEILSRANGITLWLLAAWFVYEAVNRFIDPPQFAGGFVLGTALAGIVVNLAATWLISRANRTSLNVEGAFHRHCRWRLAIVLTGWARADAVAAVGSPC